MLDRGQKTPLYEQIKNNLKEQIKNGELKANQQLPSERELENHYHVSRITIRQAIALAEREGLVTRVHGVGTFVAAPKIEQGLNVFSNFQNTVERLGLIASTELLFTDMISSDFQLSKLLNIGVMDVIYNIQLLGYGDDSPIVYYNSYFPNHIGKEMIQLAKEKADNQTPFSTIDLYSDIDETPSHLEQTFESIGADAYISDILKVKEGFPLLKITSMIYQENMHLEYRESYYRGDKYKFFTTRKLPL